MLPLTFWIKANTTFSSVPCLRVYHSLEDTYISGLSQCFCTHHFLFLKAAPHLIFLANVYLFFKDQYKDHLLPEALSDTRQN